MVQLNRSMMERYEIADRRPQTLRAAIFGADQMMLGAAARLLDRANEQGADAGAVCITAAADALNAQDGMFTLLVRGDNEDGSHTSEERVVQSILKAVNPEEAIDYAAEPELEVIFLSANCNDVVLAQLARFLYVRWEKQLPAPVVLRMGAQVQAVSIEEAMEALCSGWKNDAQFSEWIRKLPFRAMLAETLCGGLDEAERAKALHDMNYRDDFIGWAEPQIKCTPEGDVPAWLRPVCESEDFAVACERKARVFDTVVFLCVSVGYLCGKDTFAEVLKDEKLRDWIGHAFFDEVMPELPWSREEVTPWVISAFNRLENSMNNMPLLEVGRGMMHNFRWTLLPPIRDWAKREFEAPRRLSLALAAAIMLYAGARENGAGLYEVARGEKTAFIHDDPESLEAFSRLAHDMPAESLAYAALADWEIWGGDLREVDGLEMRIAFDLSSIQRIGLRETMRLQGGE